MTTETIAAVVEYVNVDNDEGYWINVRVDRVDYQQVGPFATATARQTCLDDLMDMMRQTGAYDLPAMPQ